MTEADAELEIDSWRFSTPADAPFLYDLALRLDPRCWRVSRRGTSPMRSLETFGEYAASVTVLDGDGEPCGFAGLVNLSGTIRCAALDIHALPDHRSQQCVRAVAPELVAAAFGGSPVEQLYVDHFEGDPDLLADIGCFTVDVVMPEFAVVDGELTTRITRGVTRSEFVAWQSERDAP